MENPLQLYKSIRRLHRKLPPALRFMGNTYVRDEFKRHKTAEERFIPGFMKSWTAYRDTLATQIAESELAGKDRVEVGTSFDSDTIHAMTPEQLGQAYELRAAAKRIGKKEE